MRPTILDILNKSFVRKRVSAYITECVNGGAPSDAEFDDMNYDSLKEQGEKLGLLGGSSGALEEPSQLACLKRGPIAGAMNAKKMRKVIGA